MPNQIRNCPSTLAPAYARNADLSMAAFRPLLLWRKDRTARLFHPQGVAMQPSRRRRDPMDWTPSSTLAARPRTHAPHHLSSAAAPAFHESASGDLPDPHPLPPRAPLRASVPPAPPTSSPPLGGRPGPYPVSAEEPVRPLPKQPVEGNERARISAPLRPRSATPQIQTSAAHAPSVVVSRPNSPTCHDDISLTPDLTPPAGAIKCLHIFASLLAVASLPVSFDGLQVAAQSFTLFASSGNVKRQDSSNAHQRCVAGEDNGLRL